MFLIPYLSCRLISLATLKTLAVTAFIFLLSAHFAYNLQAQTPSVKQWDYRYGGNGSESLSCFIKTNDGGYLLAGNTSSLISGDITLPTRNTTTDPYPDWWVIKINALGLKEWQIRLGGGADDRLYTAIETSDSGFLLGGMSNSLAGGDKSDDSHNYNGWLVKLNAIGNKEWDKTYPDGTTIQSIAESKSGGYLLSGTGAIEDSSRGAQDYWVLKTDTGGNKLWTRTYGGTKADFLWVGITSADGGYLLGGYTLSGMGADKTQPNWDSTESWTDIWIVKIDSAGNKEWDKSFGGIRNDKVWDIKQTADGGYILGGTSLSPISGNKSQQNWGSPNNTPIDFWVVKIDAFGNKQWDKRYGGIYGDGLRTLFITSDGGFLFGGSSESPIGGDKSENNLNYYQSWIVKTDSLGVKQWDKTIFTNGGQRQVLGWAVETNDHCYAIANDNNDSIGGYKSQLNWSPPGTGNDFWIVKLCADTSTTGVITLHANERIALYPNPTNGKLYGVIGELTPNSTIQITTIEGKAVLTGILVAQPNFEIDVSALPAGIYFLQLSNEQQRVVKKFVKQ